MSKFISDADMKKLELTNSKKSKFISDEEMSKMEKKQIREPIEESNNSLLTTADDFSRGVIGGLTFGFGDEIAGGLEAGADLLTGSTSLDKLKEAYQKHRDESRTLYKQAEERSPIASTIGNITGGIAPALLTMGGSSAVQGAGALARIAAGAKAGLASGAVSGLGTSEADSIGGDIENTAKGAAYGALAGGALTTAVEGVKGLGRNLKGVGKFIADTDLVQTPLEGRTEGLKNRDLITRSGKKAANEILDDASDEIGNTFESAIDDAGKAVGESKENIADKTYKASQAIKVLQDRIKLLENTPGTTAQKSAIELKKVLKDALEGIEKSQEVNYKTFSPDKVVPGVSSAKEELELELAMQNANRKVFGRPELKSSYVSSEAPTGKKLLTRLATAEEQVGATERAVPIFDDAGNVVSHKLSADDLAGNFTNTANVKTVLDTPGVPEQILPGEVKSFTEMLKSRVGGADPEAMTGKQLLQMKNVLTQLGGVSVDGSTLPDQIGRNFSKLSAEDFNKVLTNSEPEFASANKNYSSLIKALKNLGIKDEFFTIDPLTNEEILTPQAKNKLGSLLIRSGRAEETQSGRNASNLLKDSIDRLSDINPEAAKSLTEKTKDASNLFNLMQKTQGFNFANKSTFLKSGLGAIGNVEGLVERKARDAISSGAKSLSNLAPDEIKQMAQKLISSGSAAKMKLAQELGPIMQNKDNVSRNAAIFALQQNPEYRKMLQEQDKEEDQK